MTQNFFYYTGAVGNNSDPEYRSSGAYIFRPTSDKAQNVSGTEAEITTFEGV